MKISKTKKLQSGGAIILAILTAALVTTLTATTIHEVGITLDQVQGSHDNLQAKQLARGVVDWGRNILADDRRTNAAVDHLKEPWAIKVPPTKVEGGEISGELNELSGHFNINSIFIDGQINKQNVHVLTKLMQYAGVSQNERTTLISSIQNWYISQNQRMSQPSTKSSSQSSYSVLALNELLSIKTFKPETLFRLRPYIVALPDSSSAINVNTAPPEVLAASIEGMTLDLARVIVAERNNAWFKDTSDFKTRLQAHSIDVNADSFKVMSRYFLASGRARYGIAMVRVEALLDRSLEENESAWPSIAWQKQL